MERDEFERLIEAANRCLQEAETLVVMEILSDEATETLSRVIKVWEIDSSQMYR